MDVDFHVSSLHRGKMFALAVAVFASLGIFQSMAGVQGYLFNKIELTTGMNPSAVVTGDFNADGKPDCPYHKEIVILQAPRAVVTVQTSPSMI